MSAGDVGVGEPLELSRDGGGPRHFLALEPVHAGAAIEVLFPGDVWVLGRYEWSYDPARRPLFYFDLPGCDDGAVIGLPPGALVRWPAREMLR